MAPSVRSYLGIIRDLPNIRQRVAALEKEQRRVAEEVARTTEIIVAVRDDVRSLMVEVTEQSNRASAALIAAQGERSTSGTGR